MLTTPISLSSEEDEEAGPTLMEERYLRILPEATPQALDLSLVSSRHSLWGHRLWNAAIVLAGKLPPQDINVNDYDAQTE